MPYLDTEVDQKDEDFARSHRQARVGLDASRAEIFASPISTCSLVR